MLDYLRSHPWATVAALTVAAFVFNTSEFLPIGLLSDLAQSFDRSEADAGLIITVYAWVVLVMSLPLMLIFSRTDFKKLLLGVLALYVVSHIASVAAPSFGFLMASRIGVALSHSIFWAIATPMAVKIVGDKYKAQALGLITAGTAVAMVAGMPLGRIIGLYVSWQASFLCLGVIAALVFVVILLISPQVPGSSSPILKVLPEIFTNKPLLILYTVTALTFGGNYAAYSYIEPYLAQEADFAPATITLALIVMGGSGFLSSIIFSAKFNGHERFFMISSVAGVMLLIAFLGMSSALGAFVTIGDCLIWGLCFSLFSMSYQAVTLILEGQNAAIAMAIYSSICNLGIGGGAFLGSHLIDFTGLASLPYAAAVLLLAALLLVLVLLVPMIRHRLQAA